MIIDFHVHTSELSRCADSSLEDQVYSALEKGINALFITDHMQLHSQEKLDAINDLYGPFKVYQAIEVTVSDDNYEDILVLGVHDKAIEKRDWTYEKLYKFVKSKGGVLILAHPYRFSDRIDKNIWDYPPDGVEVLSNNIGGHNYQRRLALAERLGAAPVTNSDSHHYTTVGEYTNDFPDWCVDEESILRAIRSRDFTCRVL